MSLMTYDLSDKSQTPAYDFDHPGSRPMLSEQRRQDNWLGSQDEE